MHDPSRQLDSECTPYVATCRLLSGLRSDDDAERVATALILAELGPAADAAVPDLIAVLETSPGREARRAAAFALGRIGHEANRAVPFLLRSIDDVDSRVRAEAVRALDAILSRDEESSGSIH